MPIRYPRYAQLSDYHPYHVSAATTSPQAAGMLMDATSATAVGAAGSATITLTITDGDIGQVQPNTSLVVVDTGAQAEIALVTAVNVPAKQITVTFAKTHSGTYPVRLTRGTFLGSVSFNALGTTMALTLYNGHPNAGGSAIAVITPAATPFPFNALLEQGLFLTYTGTTAGDVTIMALPSEL